MNILTAFSFQNIKAIFTKAKDIHSADGRAHERNRRIALTALTAAISKVLSAIIPLITVRITLEYLGVELYGLWSAVISFFALFAFADLGLGNGLQTLLSQACGSEDTRLQEKIVFNSYAILTIVATFLIIAFIVVNPFINWVDIINAENTDVRGHVVAVVIAIVIPKLISIPLSLIQRVQLAYQEGYNSNIWQCIASLLSLVVIFTIYYCNSGQLMMIWASSLIPVLIFILNSAVYYYHKKHKFFNLNYLDSNIIKSLLKNGSQFFVLSILTTAGLAIDTFIVAHVSNLDSAAPFSILNRAAIMISMIVGMLCTPLWSANGEALARGEKEWVENNTRKMTKITLSFSIGFSLILLFCSKWAFRLWLGPNFTFSMWCLAGMCGTQIILSWISPYFMILNAANVVKGQIVIFSFFTFATLGLKFWLAPIYGVDIIPWISNLCYCVCIVPYVIIWSKDLLKIKK